ncbi:MAG: glycosyltransferase, partial [Planctomycetota bacterium]
PDVLIDAIADARERGLDLQLVLVGPEYEAAYARSMRSQIRQPRLEDRVTWVGFTENVSNALRAADIYALISKSEGMPNALLEAMASGLPCVASAISGVTDLICDHENGRVIDLADGEWRKAVCDAVVAYAASGSLRIEHGVRARQTVEARFSAQAVLDAHEAMFRRVLAGGPAAPNL